MKLIRILNKFGIDIKRYPSRDLSRRKLLLNEFNITDIIDVGAIFGLYGLETRAIGFKGNIYSFEPLSFLFNKQEKASKKDLNWKINNFVLGNVSEKKSINISKNYFSNSFLDQKKELVQQVSDIKYVSSEIVEIKTLHQVFHSIYKNIKKIFLKIDTQGFEKAVLNGAKGSLKQIKGLQLEMSLNPLYESSIDFFEKYNFINSEGFKLYSTENGFHNSKIGQLNEIESVFFRENRS
jgi:FkbM family methyltransferase